VRGRPSVHFGLVLFARPCRRRSVVRASIPRPARAPPAASHPRRPCAGVAAADWRSLCLRPGERPGIRALRESADLRRVRNGFDRACRGMESAVLVKSVAPGGGVRAGDGSGWGLRRVAGHWRHDSVSHLSLKQSSRSDRLRRWGTGSMRKRARARAAG
jgi:hypothetical protein